MTDTTVKLTCPNDHCCEIEIEHLVIKINRTSEENYWTNFITNLKKQICCEQVTFPFVCIQYGNGTGVKNNKEKRPLSLKEVEEHVAAIKDMCRIRKDISHIKFNPENYSC